ncbi:MAG: DUF1801 domain-containing protein [Phycisphaerales bacterium]
MQSRATTVAQYLASLPEDRRAAVSAVRKVILANLDKGYAEGMQYGMIGFFVPHSVYPPGYHCDPKQPLPFAGLASQKNHMSLYLMSVYADGVEEKWLRDRFTRAGKKLDMGKCCIRFKKLEDLPLDVIGEAIRRVPVKAHLAHYERAILTMNKQAAARAAAKGKAKPAARTPAKFAAKAASNKKTIGKAAPKKTAAAKSVGTRARARPSVKNISKTRGT